MSSLVTYKALSVLDTASGAGGAGHQQRHQRRWPIALPIWPPLTPARPTTVPPGLRWVAMVQHGHGDGVDLH